MKLDHVFFEQLLQKAANSERRRAHHNLHQHADEPVQRLCIGLKQGTYIRPHHHSQAHKWELLLCLKGQLDLVIFDAKGSIIDKLHLATNEALSGIELKPNTWHCIYLQDGDAVIMEVKQGPYTPATEADFAPWAPKEGDAAVQQFMQWLHCAQIGEHYQA